MLRRFTGVGFTVCRSNLYMVPRSSIWPRSGSQNLTGGSSKRRGLTLAELLIGLTITVLVGTATVAMLSAAAYGTTSRLGMRQLLVQHRALHARIGSAIRNALEVVAVHPSGKYVVVWVEDTNDDGTKQHGELELIEWSSATSEMLRYRDPTDTTDFTSAADYRVPILTAVTPVRWAAGVTAAEFEKTEPAGAETQIVSFRITSTRDGVSESTIGVAAVRNQVPTP
jgi:type II secretory pathway pseudopilin PulG